MIHPENHKLFDCYAIDVLIAARHICLSASKKQVNSFATNQFVSITQKHIHLNKFKASIMVHDALSLEIQEYLDRFRNDNDLLPEHFSYPEPLPQRLSRMQINMHMLLHDAYELIHQAFVSVPAKDINALV